MSDDRPTRPSRPRISVPTFDAPPTSRPFALLSKTLSAVDRIVRRHVEQAATFAVAPMPMIIVASRESDLVRLVVRMVADAALSLAVPRAPDASIRIESRLEGMNVTVSVVSRGAGDFGESGSDEIHPTLTTLAVTAGAVITTEIERDARRVIALVPLAVPHDDDAS